MHVGGGGGGGGHQKWSTPEDHSLKIVSFNFSVNHCELIKRELSLCVHKNNCVVQGLVGAQFETTQTRPRLTWGVTLEV